MSKIKIFLQSEASKRLGMFLMRRQKKIKSNSGKLRLLPFQQRLSLEQKERIFFHGLQ